MSWESQQHSLDRLRGFRLRPEREVALSRDLDALRADLRKRQRSLAGIGAAFARVVPPELAERVALDAVSRGVLTIRAPDSATFYELDRFLRGGGEAAIAKAAPVGLRRVRVVVG